MAAVREVVVGGVAGHMIAAVMERMVHVLGQHKAPEAELHYWYPERVIVLSDDNPEEKPSSSRRVVGLVIVRRPKRHLGGSDVANRFKVVLEYRGSEGHAYVFSAIVTDFEPVPDEDMAFSQV